MPDIGSTLRETRMRKRIDIVEVESHTKIRAKYLRALENEEWDLLPGTTFVKTFLRTYGDYLGLDSKMLVEEYKQRYEQPGPQDLLPFAPRAVGRRQRRSPVLGPFAIVGAAIVLLLAALYGLGQIGGGGDDGGSGNQPATATATPTTTPTASPSRSRATARFVHLRIVATGTVNVCLVSGVSGKVLIRSRDLTAGKATRVFSAKRLKVTFGNGRARMRIGGKSYDVPDTSRPIGYDLRPGRKPRVLSASARPTCAT